MRTDLTVRNADATEQHVAINAPQDTPFGAVTAALARVVAAVPTWCGARQVAPDAVVGAVPLVDGAVLSVERCDTEPRLPGVRLEVVGGAQCGHAIPLQRGEIDIGRDDSCSLTLSDPQVSRRHALLTVSSAAVRLRDLGSTHGTYVDGARLDASCVLSADTPVRVGDTTLMLRTGTTREQDTPDENPGVIELPAAPGTATRPRIQWAAALVPALAGAAFAALMHSVQFLAFAALSPVALLLGASADRRRAHRAARRSTAERQDELAKAQRVVAAAVRRESAQRRQAYPGAGALVHCPTSGWRRAQPLRARLGLADLPSVTMVRRGAQTEPATTLHAMPYVLDLGEAAVAIFASAQLRRGVARWLIVQLAVRVSPADLEFAVFTRHPEHWHWMCWLPHVRERVACAEPEHRHLIAEVADLAEARRAGWSGRSLILIIDDASTIPGVDRLSEVFTNGATAVGITALWLDEHPGTAITASMQIVRACHADRGAVRVATTDVLADRIDPATAEHLARALAPSPRQHADTAPPDVAELAALLGDDPICADAIGRRWHRNDVSARTIIGSGARGTVSIDLDQDGPHALIAGTTGSGKSELLQTLVLGLAAQYPPDEITFLLVDYKGGAAFTDCATLPHAVGVVTDLDERLTRRVLASLDSEIRRREALLADAHAFDRRTYRSRGQHLPRLVLVVDEFATLADELPTFVPGLVSIAQRGRSLGVHLVLATQRPAGAVSPEIRANAALRIALRTTSAAESMDVIDAPDAAGIDRRTPGRAYLRAGTATVEVQCARVTGPAPLTGIGVTVLDEWRRPPPAQTHRGDTAQGRYLHAIRAAAHEYPAPRRPWLPPLPWPIRLGDLTPPPGHIAFGLADLPAEQRQEPLLLDLSRGETLLFSGSSRSGRSNVLRALANAAARAHPPDVVHVHALDCTGSALADLDALPHVGTRLALRDGVTVVARLFVLLEQDMARRTSTPCGPAILLVVDGWEEFVAASDEYDNGRTTDRLLALLRSGPSTGMTIAITGARSTLAPRVASAFSTRFVLPMHDPGDYAQAGIAAHTFPDPAAPGRAVRVSDGAEVQFALAEPVAESQWPTPTPAPLRVRPLPQRVWLRELPHDAGITLGVGGDAALPIAVELRAGAGRMLIAGPARSGRSTLLRTILAQARDGPVVIAAPVRSPLADAARELQLRLISPSDPADPVDPVDRDTLLFVDDCETFADTAAGAALLEWLVTMRGRAVVAGRSDAVALDYRGLAAEIRRNGCGVLLRPGALDGELLATRLPLGRADGPVGRGVLVPDPEWHLGDEPLPIQVALA